ncbi:MAG: hypothetical protein KF812_01320 [Fimbriimonadaceae bacterium]|nr:hypothetical protein [Fimbriimonadaceae bacterium]
MKELSPALRRFAWQLGIGLAIFAMLPSLANILSTPSGSTSIGVQTAIDDHLVYAAWMKQAMEGRFFMENRFTLDPQPGLTVNLYFFALGNVARLLGIPATMLLAKGIFSLLFVFALILLLEKTGWDELRIKLSAGLACFGGGIGFLFWERFGLVLIDPRQSVSELLMGRLPIDVWQSEAFVFSSALINGLFMAALWLILVVFRSVVEARNGWGSVLKGAVAFGILMNIHSYDALLIGFVLLGLLGVSLRHKSLTFGWLVRVLAILAGCIPAALWFVRVLQQDKVFQARAATETFAPPFTPVFFGLISLLVVSLLGVAWHTKGMTKWLKVIVGGGALITLLVISRIAYASGWTSPDGYFVGWAGFGFLLLSAISLATYFAEEESSGIWWAWAWVAPIAIYVPQLFQRKLAMGMSLPWGVLAGIGLIAVLQKQNDSNRKLGMLVGVFVASLTGIFWFQRELYLLRDNVSTTTVHPVRLSPSATELIAEIQSVGGNPIVLALPGIPSPVPDSPGEFASPYLPDLNPFFVGLAGAKTYAGHWSETPDYMERRQQLGRFIQSGGELDANFVLANVTSGTRVFVVLPNRDTFPAIPMRPWTTPHEIVKTTTQYQMIRLIL